tara:strand:+ start:1974 stop:4058 length:2085 start_codon:yes stop_codon:yes gene_type:complete
MFRKPGMARRAIGILASSPEIMQAANRNIPVRMRPGGLMDRDLFQQAQKQARLMLSRPGVSYNMNEDQMTQSIYQNLLKQKQAASMNRTDQLKATAQNFADRIPVDVTQLGAFSLDTSPFARNAAGLPTRTPKDISDMTMPELYKLRRDLANIGYFRSPLEKKGVEQSRKRVDDAIAEGRKTSELFTEVENMLDSDVLMEQVTQDRNARKSPDDVSVEDVVNSERVSPLRPFGYDPSGLPDKSIITSKTKERLAELRKVLADDKKFDDIDVKDNPTLKREVEALKLSSDRRKEVEQEIASLEKLELGQDKMFRDVNIPKYSVRGYRDNENQIKNLDKMISRQEKRRDDGIEDKNDKLISAANKEIDRLRSVKERALVDRQFMTADYYESQGKEVTGELLRLGVPDEKGKDTLTDEDREIQEVENNNALASALDNVQNSLLNKDKKLNNASEVNEISVDDVSLGEGKPGAAITDINVASKYIVETNDEVTPDDKENAKEILREQGQPPELADRPDFWHYVTLAGLGIAAGESDNALTNVAKGLLMGLDQKARDDKDYRKEGYERWLAGEKLDLEKQNVELTEKQLEIQGTRAETGRLTAEAQLKRLENQDTNTFDEQFAQSIRDRVPNFPNPFEYVKSNEQRREDLNERFILDQARQYFRENTDATSVEVTGPGETKTVFYDPEKKEVSFTKPKK